MQAPRGRQPLPHARTSRDRCTIADVAVWRAAHGITDDPHPTGQTAVDFVERGHQRLLDQRVMNDVGREANAWINPILEIVGHKDQHTLALADDLAHLTTAGRDGRALLAEAAAQGELPD